MVPRNPHVGAVESFGLDVVGQPDEKHGDLGRGGNRACLGQKGRVVLFTRDGVARRIVDHAVPATRLRASSSASSISVGVIWELPPPW